MITKVLQNRDIRKKMVSSLRTSDPNPSSDDPLPYFAFCQKGNNVLASDVKMTEGGSIESEGLCPQGSKEIGVFFVQPYTNAKPFHHVISRSILSALFVDDNAKIVCSGYNQKTIMPSEGKKWNIEVKPKVLCIAPKKDSTKTDRKRTIRKLDNAFDIGVGFNPYTYIRTIQDSFNYKRKTYAPR